MEFISSVVAGDKNDKKVYLRQEKRQMGLGSIHFLIVESVSISVKWVAVSSLPRVTGVCPSATAWPFRYKGDAIRLRKVSS
jgi:hypothetical protein